ncbi:MAG: hypothetical protein IT431_06480 [Phycisphaerales bacterium]|nr:hypothetical protein [Phycisphaerales bacterium]
MRPHPTTAALACVLLGTGLARAQDAPLAGPTVTERGVPGVRAQYTDGDLGRFGDNQRAAPAPIFLQALRDLTGPDLALTPDQTALMREELRRFGGELRVFLRAHGAEVRELVEQLPASERGRAGAEVRALQRLGEVLDRVERDSGLGREDTRPAGRRADRPGGPDQDRPSERAFRLDFRARPGAGAPAADRPMEDSDPEMMMMTEEEEGSPSARLAGLRALAPSPGALQTRLWELLTEAQREAVGAALTAYMDQERARIEQQRLAREIAQRQDAGRATDRSTLPVDGARGSGLRGLDARTIDAMLKELDRGVIPETLLQSLSQAARERIEALPSERRAPALARFLRGLPKDPPAGS